MTDRLNWSTLKELSVSPRKLQWRVENPRPDSDAMRLGRAIDCLLLEPAEFPVRYVTPGQCPATKKNGDPCENPGVLVDSNRDWYCRVKSHAPENAGDLIEGVEILPEDAREKAKRCADAVAAHRPSMELIEGARTQVEMEWTDESGLLCRGRCDGISKYGILFDLKTTRHETPRQFERDVAYMLYHGQLAWYYDGAIRCGEIPDDAPPPAIISVSTGEMPDVARWRLTGPDLEAGRCVYKGLVARYLECKAAGYWPGHSPDERVIELRDFDPGMQGVA